MFDSAKLKLRRAELHLRDLDRALAGFDASRACKIRCDSRYRPVWLVVLDEPLPPEIMLIAGDAVHNLRCALDHCSREIVSAGEIYSSNSCNRPTAAQRRSANFPISFEDERKFEQKLRNPAFSEASRYFFRRVAAYPSGSGASLVALADLDDEDKHAVIVRLMIECKLSDVPSRVAWNRVGAAFPRDYIVNLQVNERRCVSTHFGTHFGAAVFASGFEAPYIVPDVLSHELKEANFGIHIRQPAPYPESKVAPTLLQLHHQVQAVLTLAEREQLGFKWP